MNIILFVIKKDSMEKKIFEVGVDVFVSPSDIIKYICVNKIENATINYISYDSDNHGYEFEPLLNNKILINKDKIKIIKNYSIKTIEKLNDLIKINKYHFNYLNIGQPRHKRILDNTLNTIIENL
jgi:hypothetical protein